jgi:hypothetical protein
VLFGWFLICILIPGVVVVLFVGLFLGLGMLVFLLLLFKLTLLELFELLDWLCILPIIFWGKLPSWWLKLRWPKILISTIMKLLLFFILGMIISLDLWFDFLLPYPFLSFLLIIVFYIGWILRFLSFLLLLLRCRFLFNFVLYLFEFFWLHTKFFNRVYAFVHLYIIPPF